TLVALGYNIPLAQTGVFNFAQGQIVVFGTFFAWFVMGDHGWPWWVAIIGGAAAGGLIAAVEELLAIRPVVAKGSHALLVTTVGASVIIEGVLLATWGSTTRSVNFFAGNNAFSLLGGRILPVDLWLIAAAVVISFGLHAVSRYTLWGLAGRAATDDMAAAVVRGVNVTRLRMSAFILAGALGAALGPLIAPVSGIDVSTGISLTIYGFVALALGGFGSFPGCLFGGMAIGLVESYASRYFGVAYPPLILFGILILLLLLKPAGLFGQRGLRVV
ncbi:MAG TPA: branched-chain amino acid ABC transporter permease, partial [Streptosporangiaceae bacterium]|nr:branched-chain amino acid ABC transporter permease [Streptosporangiaceae bacterium]